jgi:hypothetical protein
MNNDQLRRANRQTFRWNPHTGLGALHDSGDRVSLERGAPRNDDIALTKVRLQFFFCGESLVWIARMQHGSCATP